MIRLDVIVTIFNFIMNSLYEFNFKLLPNVFYRRTGEAVVLPFENLIIADNYLNVSDVVSPSNDLDDFLVDVFVDETENNEAINIDEEHDIEINVDIKRNNIVASINNQLLNKSSEFYNSYDYYKDEITSMPTSTSTPTMKTIVQNLNNDITKLRQSIDEVNHVFNFKHDILSFMRRMTF